jgi:hypothetical protein
MLEDILNSPFHNYHPRDYRGKYYITHSLGVRSLGFIRIKDTLVYEYIVESPSSQDGKRWYVFPFTNDSMTEENTERQSTYFKGLIGESIMRITFMEFLRRNQNELGIKEFHFTKREHDPRIVRPETPVLAGNDDYQARFRSRYNIEMIALDHRLRAVAEYDGLLFYKYARDKKGLVICESKTGTLEHLQGMASEQGRRKAAQRYIGPICSLFPDYQKDLLLMARPDNIFDLREHRRINQNMVHLYDYLMKNGIGLILSDFNRPMAEIDRTSEEIVSVRKGFFKDGIPIVEEAPKYPDQVYIIADDVLRLIKGRRVEMILERTSDKGWRTIFTSRAKSDPEINR